METICDSEDILKMIDEYLREHFYILSDPDFELILLEDLKQLCGIPTELEDTDVFDELNIEYLDIDYNRCKDTMLYECLYYYYLHFMPRRSFETSFVYSIPDVEKVSIKISNLKGKPQPVQRTSEWYLYRHNILTASNLYKVFGSQALQNELVLEKCIPPTSYNTEDTNYSVNTSSSLHWGVKYEPLSVLLYEDIYKTTVEELGCITHDVYSFIGASPDGINSNPTSPLYGRLLEIKNVKSRIIDGTICDQYWVQMQIQMEVCDIDDCDFLETKFTEYDTYTEYLADTCEPYVYDEEDGDEYDYAYTKYTSNKIYKGVILYLHKPGEKPMYVYKPFHIVTINDEVNWETSTIEEYEAKGYQWVTNIYWKLVVFNCQLVVRNRFWFSKALPCISRLWDTILHERDEGFEHRRPSTYLKKNSRLV